MVAGKLAVERPPFFPGNDDRAAAAEPARTLRDVELTILMPCLNEAKTVATCVRKARAFIEQAGIRGEVLVADNGSTDGSQELAREAGARVIHVPVRGYGAALTAGIRDACGKYVIMGDADDSYDFSSLAPFVQRLREGAQLVMGNRFQGGIAPGAMAPLHQYLGNPVLSFLGRLFFRTHVGDFHCGLRGFDREAMQELRLVSTGMEFASEMVAKSALARLRIAEVPTTLRPDGRGRPPHLRTWRDGWRHLRFLLLFCPRWLFLYPGVSLLTLGVAAMALLGAGPVRLLSFGLDIHSLLYSAAATVLGAQMVVLAVLTKWMAVRAGIVPRPGWLNQLSRVATVEFGLFASLIVILLGLSWSVAIVLDWRSAGFGPLDPVQAMRQAIPAVTLMILGFQAGAASLFAAALDACWSSARQEAHV